MGACVRSRRTLGTFCACWVLWGRRHWCCSSLRRWVQLPEIPHTSSVNVGVTPRSERKDSRKALPVPQDTCIAVSPVAVRLFHIEMARRQAEQLLLNSREPFQMLCYVIGEGDVILMELKF